MQPAVQLSSLELAMEGLASEGWQGRQAAAEALIQLSQSYDATERDALIDLLICEVADPRTIGSRASAQEVLTHLGRAVVPRVLTRVRAQGTGSRLLVDLIAFLGEEQDVPALKEIYDQAQADQNLRAAIASVLGAIGGAQAGEALLSMLDDPEDHLRVFALDGLRMARVAVDPKILESLAKQPLTCKAAVSMFGYCQDASCIPILVEFLCAKIRGVRAAALVSIGGLLAWAKSEDDDAARSALYEALAYLPAQAKEQLVSLARNGDREVLCTALDVAQVCVHVPLLGVAVDYMDDGAVYERSISLASICGESTLEFFESWLDDPVKASVLEPVYRLVAMSGVAGLDPQWQGHLLAQVQGGQIELASAACEVLGKCGDQNTLSSLYPYCEEDGPLGESAADAISHLLARHRKRVRALMGEASEEQGRYASRFCSGPLARNLCRVIGKIGDSDANGFLEQVLHGPDVEARIAAIVALGRVPSQARTESLLRLALADEDAQARAAACRSLARLGICRAEAGLVSATGDVSAFVRAAAVQSLVKLNCTQARERLLEMIDAPDSPAVLAYAIEGLGKWCVPEDKDKLIALTGHEDLEIVKAAIRGLDQYTDQDAVDAVVCLLAHERWDVRWVSAQALKERGDPRTLIPIKEAAASEEDPLVHETLEAALQVSRESAEV